MYLLLSWQLSSKRKERLDSPGILLDVQGYKHKERLKHSTERQGFKELEREEGQIDRQKDRDRETEIETEIETERESGGEMGVF